MKESSLLDLKQMARELSDLEKRIWGSREERFRFVARQTAILDALDLEKLFWGSEEERFHYIAQLKVTHDALDLEARLSKDASRRPWNGPKDGLKARQRDEPKARRRDGPRNGRRRRFA